MPSKDYEWFLKADKSKYKEGEYVVIIDQKVVATARENLKEVLREVRKKFPSKIPLIAKIPSTDTLILVKKWL